MHPARPKEGADGDHIGVAPSTSLAARRIAVSVAVRPQRAKLAVDPAEAEGLLDGLCEGDARAMGALLPVPDPQLRRGGMVRLEPGPELPRVPEKVDRCGSAPGHEVRNRPGRMSTAPARRDGHSQLVSLALK